LIIISDISTNRRNIHYSPLRAVGVDVIPAPATKLLRLPTHMSNVLLFSSVERLDFSCETYKDIRTFISILLEIAVQWCRQLWGTGAGAPRVPNLRANYPSIVLHCEISWCRCQQLTALSISTAL